jgi:hypothetical protein
MNMADSSQKVNQNYKLKHEVQGNESDNFAFLKGAAILIVIVGHFCHITNFWIVVTVGLLLFSSTSGYFTLQRYQADFSYKMYWKKKLMRLAPSLFIIYLFLFLLFIFQGRENLWSWHTVVNILGMNGFLNWFRIHNQSPYGAGMWFLTLILLFYALYPFLKHAYINKSRSIIFSVSALILFYILNRTIEYGHALWMTSFGFFMGMMLFRNNLWLSSKLSSFLVMVSGTLMLLFHYYFAFDAANYFFIMAIACGILLYFRTIQICKVCKILGVYLSSILLELYLIHPYLYIELTEKSFINQFASIALVFIVASILGTLSKRLSKLFSFHL